MKGNENGGLQQIIDKALADMGHDRASGGFDPGAVNLAEFQRLTGLSRSRARTLRKKGFSCVHGRTGSRAETTVAFSQVRIDRMICRKSTLRSRG